MATTAIAAAAIVFVASADPVQAQSIENVGFEDGTLNGWTAGGGTGTQAPDSYDGNGVGVSVVTGMEDFTSGGSTYQWTVTPYGDYMASLQAVNSGNTFATGSTELGLTATSQAEITSTLGASATTASWIYQDLTLNAGDSFTMAWQYVSTDYDPYNDASYTSLVNIDDNSILATVNNLASQYALLGATVPGTGNYSTGSYGATGWQLSTYSVDTAGTYRLGFMSLNLKDTQLSPVFFVDQAPGATFNFDDPFGPIAPNEGSEAPTTPPPPPTGPTTTDISGTVNASDIADSGAFLGGTLLIDLASMTLAQGFTINGSGATIDTNGNQSTFTGTISDETSGTPGSLTISGSGGTVTLTGTNVYTGATTVGAGTTLALTGTGSIAGSSEIIVDGTFDISGTDAGAQIEDLSGGGTVELGGQNLTITNAENSFDGIIGGTGGLIQAGGLLVLNGANTFSGGFTLAGGTLGIGNNSALGTGTLDAAGGTTIAYGDGVVAPNAVVIQGPVDFSQDGGSATQSGDISGAGGLTKTGSGNLLLTGSNSYTGGTTIAGGTLTGSTTSLTGDVLNNAALVIDQDTDGTFAGDVSGSGSLTKDGDGNVTLTGANTYTGGTTIAGGTLTGSTTSLTGDVFNNAALVIDQDTDGTFAGDVSGSGSLTKDGDGNVTLTGANTYTGGTTIAGGTLTGSTTSLTGDVLNNAALVIDQDTDGTFAGDVSGSGSLTKDGDGNVTLTGANSYTGGTTIAGGTLTGSTTSLTGDVLNNAALVIDQDTDGAFAGDVSGTGSLTKDGDGNVTLTGANSYTGGTAILGGTLTGWTTSLTGNVLNNAALVIDQDTDGTFAGDVSGSGSLTKNGDGNVTLTGANSYTGGTTIAGGTLTGSSISLTGDVLNNAALVIDQDTDGTFAGDVSGSGSLTKNGDGNVTLTGVNSYAGGTTIAGGTLTASTISLTGDVLNNAALVIDQDTDGALAGDVSGSGSLTKDGDGNVTLTGANTYTGGTAILGGTLTASTTSLGGYVLNNADLVIDEDADADFAGMLAGTGNVEKTGSGIVTLSGMHMLSGETTISQGGLNVVGDYSASAITVGSGALLTGNGIVGDVFVGDGATLAPNGMLVADGGVTFAMGSTLLVNADADGNADMLGVTGALDIQGGTVSVLAADGNYDWQTGYAIVAADTVSGAFDAVVTDLAFLDPSLVYSANGVALVLTRNDLAFADVAVTANQRAAGQAFDASFDPTTDAYYAFASLNGTMARETLDALSGEVHATVANTAWQDSARIRRAVLERLDLPRTQGANLWLQIEAGRDDWNGNASAAGYLRETMSYVGGLEFGTGKSKLGIAIGHTDGDMQLASRASSVSVKGTHGHAYAGSDFGALRLAVGASYADLSVETDRNVAFGAIDQDLSADYGAKVYGAYARAGVLLPIGKGAIEPFAGITWNRFDRDGFAETGGSLALDAADEKADWTFSSLGLKGHVTLDAQDKVAFRFVTEWQRALDGRATTATMAFGNGPDFTVNGAPLAKHAGLVDVGVHWKLSPDVGFAVSYGGTVARQGFSQNGRATLSLRF
ncbi:autotransporter-associated beta strand repeat-containing protein [Croceicoccus sediminis]|uniref:autotransporter-associated beta strand repeat-containing protein n=1 Tax=Croceicoccus sediminis TaxID=2571150 RepID=UPI001478C0E9|nr:autotransporter-associated beta strand repeat-containing protein [Croceicoccus sediminis]